MTIEVKCINCGKEDTRKDDDPLTEGIGHICDICGCSPDWEGTCEICGDSPIVPVTGMCGPCTFGEADTMNGNW